MKDFRDLPRYKKFQRLKIMRWDKLTNNEKDFLKETAGKTWDYWQEEFEKEKNNAN